MRIHHACNTKGSFQAYLTALQKADDLLVVYRGVKIRARNLPRMPTILGIHELRVLHQINPNWNKRKKLATLASGAVASTAL